MGLSRDPRVQSGPNASNPRDRMLRALAENNWIEASDIMDDATGKDVKVLTPLIKRLLADRHWVVRASAVEMVGTFGLRQFVREVKQRLLGDPNAVVRTYALGAYYDLLGAKALTTIRGLLDAENTRVRTAALVIEYVETGREDALSRLTRLIMRKRGHFFNREVAFHRLEHYLDLKDHPRNLRDHPQVRILLESMLKSTPKEHGLAKELCEVLVGNCGRSPIKRRVVGNHDRKRCRRRDG